MSATIMAGQSFASYVKDAAVNQSSLKVLHKQSPAHFKHAWDNPDELDKPAFIIGRAVHTKVLEPAKFDDEFVLSKFTDFRTKEAREWRESQTRSILKADDMQAIDGMVASIQRPEWFKKALSKCDVEANVNFRDSVTKIMLKARLDMVYGGEKGAIFDLKTAQSANRDKFSRDFREYAYHFQAAFYSMAFEAVFGCKPMAFFFVVVEKEPPFVACRYKVSPEAIDAGMQDVRRSLDTLAECQEKDDWPGYPDESLDLPVWAQREYPDVYTHNPDDGGGF